MSVTIDGIKGYEYQYKVTVLIGLLFGRGDIELLVEEEDKEDICLVFNTEKGKKRVEIQVKRESGSISISKLVDWLTHFPARKTENNLLQRLFDEDCIVLFVTHSRCSDDTVRFKKNLSELKEHDNPFKKGWIAWRKKFIDSLKEQTFSQKTLKVGRKQYCQGQANGICLSEDFVNLFNRCLILEEFTDEKVDKFIMNYLNQEYAISESKSRTVYLELQEIVKTGRDSRKEISSDIQKFLRTQRIGVPQISSYYRERTEEKILIQKLEEKKVLLLTGLSQCGKSELSKKISSFFIEKGYDFKVFDNVYALNQSLYSGILEKRISLLEDPFGSVSKNYNCSEILRKIQEVIESVRSANHLLIITSRMDVLSGVFSSESIDDYTVSGCHWDDLTIRENDVLDEYWKHLSREKGLSEEIIDIVSDGINKSRSEDLLQIGQLSYLVNEDLDKLVSKDFNKLSHIARRDSRDIASKLKDTHPDAAELLSIISICSTPVHAVGFSELAYIFSEGSILVSIRKDKIFTTHFGLDEEPPFPTYSDDYILSEEMKKALEYLEERQFITAFEESVLLKHPNYYEAGRYIFVQNGSLRQKRKLEEYKKTIACLSSLTAYQASNNFSFIYDNIDDRLRYMVFEIAFLGLKSIFPAVEDNSLVFLMNHLSKLKESDAKLLISNIQRGVTSESYIYWNGTVPFIANDGNMSNMFHSPDKTTLERVEQQLSERRLPVINEAWVYVVSLKNSVDVTKQSFEMLLQYNEAFFRCKVVYQIFRRPNVIDKNLLEAIFQDNHPSVVFSAFRASLINWFDIPDSLKDQIKGLAMSSMTNEAFAIRSFGLMSNFSIDYSAEAVLGRDMTEKQKKELWNLWGELFPICNTKVPLGAFINTARFSVTMRTGIQYLTVDKGLTVLEAWYNRVDFKLQNKIQLDDFEMVIAEEVLNLTADKRKRKNLFDKIIDYEDTNFILPNLVRIVSHWDNLSVHEKEKVYSLINSSRVDVRWIKATLLTVYSPPLDIVKVILGDENFFDQSVPDIIENMPEGLLRDCLNVYCGFPQPLWWLAIHHNNDKLWIEVIKKILLDENHRCFDICLYEFLDDGVNGFSEIWSNWEELWVDVCSRVINKDILVTNLIYHIARCTCNITIVKKLWMTLIRSYASEEDILNVIRLNIEMLQETGCRNDIFKFFEEEFINELVLGIDPDGILLNSLAKTDKLDIEENMKVKLIESILTIYKQKNIKLIYTYEYIECLCEKYKMPEVVFKEYNMMQIRIKDVGESMVSHHNKRYEYKLDNWIGVI